MPRRQARLWVVCALLMLAAGCAASEPPIRYAVMTADLPPAPKVEVLPPAPSSQHVWIDGYWYRTPGGYVWLSGHWATRPDRHFVWQRSGWVRASPRYRFYPGRWVLRGEPPPHYIYDAPERRQGDAYRALTHEELRSLMKREGALPIAPRRDS